MWHFCRDRWLSGPSLPAAVAARWRASTTSCARKARGVSLLLRVCFTRGEAHGGAGQVCGGHTCPEHSVAGGRQRNGCRVGFFGIPTFSTIGGAPSGSSSPPTQNRNPVVEVYLPTPGCLSKSRTGKVWDKGEVVPPFYSKRGPGETQGMPHAERQLLAGVTPCGQRCALRRRCAPHAARDKPSE